MHARAAYYRVDPDRMGEAEEAFRAAGSEIAQLDGFVRGLILGDSESGVIVTITVWENRDKLDRSEVRAASLRQQAVKAIEGDVERIERYGVITQL